MILAYSSGGACWSAAFNCMNCRWACKRYQNRLADVRGRPFSMGLCLVLTKNVKRADTTDGKSPVSKVFKRMCLTFGVRVRGRVAPAAGAHANSCEHYFGSRSVALISSNFPSHRSVCTWTRAPSGIGNRQTGQTRLCPRYSVHGVARVESQLHGS